MKISTKGRYGLRTLMDISIHQTPGPVNLNDIAERQGISAKYLWQIVNLLKTAGFVRGTRGPKGGYVLIRDPADITMLDVIQLSKALLLSSNVWMIRITAPAREIVWRIPSGRRSAWPSGPPCRRSLSLKFFAATPVPAVPVSM